jgi:tetratricopeptide (TPR) repeat protein
MTSRRREETDAQFQTDQKDRKVSMLPKSPAISTNARSLAARAFALGLAVLSLNVGGCALWICDDGYCPVPYEPVYVVPADPAPGAPGVYYYTPSASFYYLGQAPTKVSAETQPSESNLVRGQETYDDFPTFDDSFPTVDFHTAPPESSELSEFATTGAEVAEPTGQYESIDYDENFRPRPKRESLADRAKTEEELKENFETWLLEKEAQRKENSRRTKRYLQPIDDGNCELFDRSLASESEEEESEGMISTVTLAGLEMMLENEESKRELYDWEKEVPTPIDWSKYALSLDNIRSWIGLGPNERAALEYMRRACNKQNEYMKTQDKKTLREAALLYEKAADRWPGPALRPDYARKHPYDMPKTGTLIEEDGIFFAGECWFFCREFNRALTCYKALVSTYTSSIYKDIAMKRLYYIGCYWVECSEEATVPSINVTQRDKPVFSSFAGAEKAFSTIFLNDASDNGYAPEALFALANAYMRRGVKQGDGSFDSAARYYKQLYEFYPGNRHAEDACRLAVIALHKSYQGEFYDDAPLNEARQLAETILKSGRGDMDVIYEELESIKNEQAHRLYALGGYYERRGSYASARTYYNRLVKEYPNSDYAVAAARQYQLIADKPAEADQLGWARAVVPFLPKSNNQFFEEAPAAELAEIARRDESLDSIGQDPDSESREALTAEAPSERKRFF